MNVNRFGVAAIAVFVWAGMAGEAGAQGAFYVQIDQTGVARAFCASGEPVLGGGASSIRGSADRSLRQTSPISDKSGASAFDTTAIGWQAATLDAGSLVRAYAVCADALLAAALSVQYVSQAATGLARAYCPAGTKVIGGGGFVTTGKDGGLGQLRQTYPISDESGVIAWGRNAIGWQVASSDFKGNVVAFAVCATSPSLQVEYRSTQANDDYRGSAMAICPAGTIVTGGGGFVETSPYEPVALRATYPIADETGVGAYDRNAIGWQTISNVFIKGTVVSLVVCLSGT